MNKNCRQCEHYTSNLCGKMKPHKPTSASCIWVKTPDHRCKKSEDDK